ncbi:MAG: hypothetical protein AB1428_13505, partial [Bacteroidota bacterium]
MILVRALAILLFAPLVTGTGRAQTNVLDATLPPDPRMKADILLIVAHPDDETAVGSYLAK